MSRRDSRFDEVYAGVADGGRAGLRYERYVVLLEGRQYLRRSLAPIAVDPLGCGDALLATSALALASGADLLQASFLGAVSASQEAQQLGNIPISASSVRQTIARVHSAHLAYATIEISPRSLERAS